MRPVATDAVYRCTECGKYYNGWDIQDDKFIPNCDSCENSLERFGSYMNHPIIPNDENE